MGVMFGGGAVLVLPVLLTSSMHWVTLPRGTAVVVHLAVVTTFVAYRLFGYGLRHTTAQTATTLTLAEPAVATLLGVVLLSERLPALSWCGLGVLSIGLAVLTLPASFLHRRTELRNDAPVVRTTLTDALWLARPGVRPGGPPKAETGP
jgi:DME family drug/metabolite transporter